MQIIYDGHIFRWQRNGGISRYFREIISHLPADWTPTLIGIERPQAGLPKHDRLRISQLSSVRPRRLSQPIKREWWRLSFGRKAALLHPTYYPLTGGLRFSDFSCPVVITAHDFIGATYPTLEDNAAEILPQQREAFQHATHVVCVSKATETDLVRLYPELAGRTSVIYHGSSFPVCREPQAKSIFDRPTFLFVGRRATYKNFLFIVRAFARACRYNSKIRLHTAGPALTEDERWQIHFAGISDRVDSTVNPDDAALHRLYRDSVALLYPSRHEGFGIPPLEAMSCGTVVVSSNSTSLPEVVGDGGIMLDPTNEEAWTEYILNVAERRIDRAGLLARGSERASHMTWEKSARAHVALYQQLLQNPRGVAAGVPAMARA